VLFAINILNFYDRGVLGALNEPVRKEFGLSDTQIGAITTAFTLLYAVIGVPIGRIADKWNRKKLLAGGVSLWSLLTGLTAFANSYGFLMFARLGVGVGEAVCAPVGTSWLGDLFPAGRRARALALFMLGVPIGMSLSNLLSGPVAQAYGWRAAMIVAALPALLLVPALLSLHEPVRGASEAKAPGPLKSAWSIIRIPTLWWIIASGAVLNFMMYAFSTFLASFLMRVHGFSIGSTGVSAGCVYLIGGVLGGLAGGRIGDYVIRKRRDGRMVAAAAAALAAAPFAYFGILQPPGAALLALPLLGCAYACFNMYYGLVYSSIHDIVSPALRGTTMAFYFMVMYLGGASFGSLITGNLSDRMARRAAAAAGSSAITEAAKAIGLQQAMFIIPVLAIALALVLYAGSRTIEGDMRKA
jgi:predicted MFS family arabinose efflux permease